MKQSDLGKSLDPYAKGTREKHERLITLSPWRTWGLEDLKTCQTWKTENK